ncbi:toxin-antitoxin system YwqK family antitoxin [Algibacter pacificus]|uniref:toxin-antitoxin system YwqK family antitoxin n=1 Tax=Algibacter pacificus TaxID=2599389 RepID=UPI0011C8BD1C|nr:toxin-antitoxin system YwqK family antitoxin [Algibacter pacificus]
MNLFKIVAAVFFLSSLALSAQNINQFDSDGKRHGIWTKNFENTDVIRYEGEFFHGKEVGTFKFYKNIKMKPVLSAVKQFNKENNIAEVSFLASTGKVISTGKMAGKAYIGTWKYYHKNNDNLLILEHFDDLGQLTGERFVYYENGQIAEKQFYISGELHGELIGYSEKGVVLKSFIYEAGELHGLSKVFNGKGELIIEGAYKRGKKYGAWKYYENGKLKEEKRF